MAEFNRSDVESVQRKLQALSNELPEQEQNVLAWVMTRQSPAELSDEELEDVAGGSQVEGEDSISVTWSKSME